MMQITRPAARCTLGEMYNVDYAKKKNALSSVVYQPLSTLNTKLYAPVPVVFTCVLNTRHCYKQFGGTQTVGAQGCMYLLRFGSL